MPDSPCTVSTMTAAVFSVMRDKSSGSLNLMFLMPGSKGWYARVKSLGDIRLAAPCVLPW